MTLDWKDLMAKKTSLKGKPKLLLVGAATSLGKVIADEAIDLGWHVRGIDNTVPRDELQVRGVDYHVGDLGHRDFLSEQLEGMTHVIQARQDRRVHAAYEDLAAINLDLTEDLFELSADAAAKTFIYLSNARICAPSDTYLGEGAEIRAISGFEQTIRDAEILLRGLANRLDGAPALRILRLAPVYGKPGPPEGQPWFAIPPLLRLFFTLTPGLVGGPRCHCVHAKDVARAALFLAARDTEKSTETYHVADDTPLNIGEFISDLIQAYGYALGVQVPLPATPILRALVARFDRGAVRSIANTVLSQLWARVVEQHDILEVFRPSLGEQLLSSAFEDFVFNNGKLKEAGFELSYPDVRIGLREAVAEYQKAGYLPSDAARRQALEHQESAIRIGFNEILTGSFKTPDWSSGPGEFRVNLEATAKGFAAVMAGVWNLDGTITMDGLAEEAEVIGTLEMAPFGRRRLDYEFGFAGNSGGSYRLFGQKTVRYLRPLSGLAKLPFTVSNERGDIVAEGTATFDLKSLPKMLGSLRIGR